jgi:hypothetical protein
VVGEGAVDEGGALGAGAIDALGTAAPPLGIPTGCDETAGGCDELAGIGAEAAGVETASPRQDSAVSSTA